MDLSDTRTGTLLRRHFVCALTSSSLVRVDFDSPERGGATPAHSFCSAAQLRCTPFPLPSPTLPLKVPGRDLVRGVAMSFE